MTNTHCSREEFVSALDSIRRQSDKDKMFSVKASKLFDTDIPCYNNSILLNLSLKLLRRGFSLNIEVDQCDIERFCWEMDFGRDKRSTYTDSGSLWDALVKRKSILNSIEVKTNS